MRFRLGSYAPETDPNRESYDFGKFGCITDSEEIVSSFGSQLIDAELTKVGPYKSTTFLLIGAFPGPIVGLREFPHAMVLQLLRIRGPR